MTWWETEHWKAYERAYGNEPGTRVRELAEATWLTHVVDLTPTEEDLWRKIPKTMRQAIRKSHPLHSVIVPAPFFHYEHCHISAAIKAEYGPRPTATYEAQESWLNGGHAVIASCYDCGIAAPVAACLVIRYEGWAYYASGPSLQPHVMPSLIWAAIKECKLLGDLWFEVGWLKGDTEKERSIARFKSRWGGENKPANWLAMEEACWRREEA